MLSCPAAGTTPGLTVRLLPFRMEDGPTNMALDEALLATAVEGEASLRFYGWSVPTLSLGYFQPSAPALARFSLPWLRRATGGAALVHHHELTYALALPAGRAWQPPGTSWVCQFHHAVRRALESFGIASHVCQTEAKHGEVLCFLHHTPGDLLIGTSKVAGSAQRKSHGAILQHGGILLRQSPYTPQLPGINDLSARRITPEELQQPVASAFTEATGWHLAPQPFRPSEEQRAGQIRQQRYLSPEWNERR
jgi:lipoate-protein ligase A